MPTYRGTQCYVNILRDVVSCIRDGVVECVYGRHTFFQASSYSVNHASDVSGAWTLVREKQTLCPQLT